MPDTHENISKFIYQGDTIFDLTEDTVSENNLLLGATAHNEFGDAITGAVTADSILRHDTLTNWNASSVVLNLGEPALASYIDQNGQTNFVMKIGDGENLFEDLPFFHYYNIQVLDHAPTASETNNNMITFVV